MNIYETISSCQKLTRHYLFIKSKRISFQESPFQDIRKNILQYRDE